jgi:hypothetical protein
MEDVERAHRRLGHLLSDQRVTACEKCGGDPERREFVLDSGKKYRSCTGCGACETEAIYQARRHREEEARTNVVEIPQASTANPELVQMLEHLLAKAKAGEAIGLVAAIQLTGREVATAMGGTFNPFLMLGHLEWVKMRLAVSKIGGTLDG